MAKAIIFDMDGVLVNTPLYARKTVNKILEDKGIHFSEEEFKEYQGVSSRDRVKIWNNKYNINIDIEQFSKKFILTQLDLMKHELKENKEIVGTFKSLKKQNLKIAVATSSQKLKAERILRSLDIIDLIDFLVTSDDILNHKPHPEIYLTTSKLMNVEPNECVVIEDSPKGITAGKKAGMKVFALKTTLFSIDELKDADLIITKLSEIEV